MPSQDIFQGIVQWKFNVGEREGKLPVFYRDLTSLTVSFTASTRAVAERLPHRDMHPLEVIPGRCVAGFTAFEYRDSDIGPYNELSIAFPIAFGHRPLPALSVANALRERRLPVYVWKLPVTTEIAYAAGVELYGLPKSLADIRLERRGSEVECRLSAGGQEVLDFGARMPPPGRAQVTRLKLYSMKEGVPVTANVLIEPIESGETARAEARLHLGSGPIADELRAMDVGGRPLFAVWVPRGRAVLFGPRNLADD